MPLKHYWSLLIGKTNASAPAKLTFRNIYAVFQAFFRKARRGLGGVDLPTHIYEQIIWRRTEVMKKSPRCWNEGACIKCGCEIIGKTMEDRPCDGNCYPEMMNKEQWHKYKSNNINLFE